jgi:hypothetical protein
MLLAGDLRDNFTGTATRELLELVLAFLTPGDIYGTSGGGGSIPAY